MLQTVSELTKVKKQVSLYKITVAFQNWNSAFKMQNKEFFQQIYADEMRNLFSRSKKMSIRLFVWNNQKHIICAALDNRLSKKLSENPSSNDERYRS